MILFQYGTYYIDVEKFYIYKNKRKRKEKRPIQVDNTMKKLWIYKVLAGVGVCMCCKAKGEVGVKY